jgi:Derlin-2/3
VLIRLVAPWRTLARGYVARRATFTHRAWVDIACDIPPVLSLKLAIISQSSTHNPTLSNYRDTAIFRIYGWTNMANVLGGGEGGMMGGFPLEQWFYEMPVCTRWWMTAALSASVLVQCDVISPFQLFYSVRTVFFKSQVRLVYYTPAVYMLMVFQYWRLVTTFFYFGPLSLDLLYHIFFLQRYSRLLEESSGRSAAHFLWLLTFAASLILCIAPIFSMPFLGSALSSTLIYIWSRKNPDTLLSFLGLLVFKAPYLPWVLLGFSLMMHGTVPKDEMCGIVVGHSRFPEFVIVFEAYLLSVWYYFNDIYPTLHQEHRPLDPPSWWIRMIEGRPAPVAEEPAEEVAADATGQAVNDGPAEVAPVQ